MIQKPSQKVPSQKVASGYKNVRRTFTFVVLGWVEDWWDTLLPSQHENLIKVTAVLYQIAKEKTPSILDLTSIWIFCILISLLETSFSLQLNTHLAGPLSFIRFFCCQVHVWNTWPFLVLSFPESNFQQLVFLRYMKPQEATDVNIHDRIFTNL